MNWGQKKEVKLGKKILLFLFVLSVTSIMLNEKALANQRLPILLYHHLLPEAYIADNESILDNGMVVSQELFARHMEYLYLNDYHTITSSELRGFLYENQELPPNSVMITFDDGYLSNYLFAYPILQNFGFNAIVFTITGFMQTRDQEFNPDRTDMLSWMQIASSSDVFEFASHSHLLHTFNNGISGFVSASIDEARSDLILSQRRVQNRRVFSFPFGQYNRQLVDMLRFNGVDLAFTIHKGYVTRNSDPLLLNRFTIYSNTSLSQFQHIVRGNYR